MPSSTNASRTPGRFFTSSTLALDDLAAEHRALRVRRVQHPRQLHVDAEQRRARDDLLIVDAGHARAEQLEVLRVLERRVRRRRERRGLRRELAVGRATLRRGVNHGALVRSCTRRPARPTSARRPSMSIARAVAPARRSGDEIRRSSTRCRPRSAGRTPDSNRPARPSPAPTARRAPRRRSSAATS